VPRNVPDFITGDQIHVRTIRASETSLRAREGRRGVVCETLNGCMRFRGRRRVDRGAQSAGKRKRFRPFIRGRAEDDVKRFAAERMAKEREVQRLREKLKATADERRAASLWARCASYSTKPRQVNKPKVTTIGFAK
jgi:hypothetical protein